VPQPPVNHCHFTKFVHKNYSWLNEEFWPFVYCHLKVASGCTLTSRNSIHRIHLTPEEYAHCACCLGDSSDYA